MTELKKNTTDCPCCKTRMSFECVGTMRVERGGFYNAKCLKTKKNFKVKK